MQRSFHHQLEECPLVMEYSPNEDVSILAVGEVNGSVHILSTDIDRGIESRSKYNSNVEMTPRSISWLTQKDVALGDHRGVIRVLDVNAGNKEVWTCNTVDQANCEVGIDALTCFQDNLIAMGDEMGVLNVFDTRIKGSEPVWSCLELLDEVSINNIYAKEGGSELLVSGDNFIGTFNIRTSDDEKQLIALSDPADGDITRVTVCPDEKSVITSHNDNSVSLWKWGHWGKAWNRYTPPVTDDEVEIGDIFSFDENSLLVGLSDGRIVQTTISPFGIVGTLGQHMPGTDIGCEIIKVNYAYDTVATAGMGKYIQIMPLRGDVIEAADAVRREGFTNIRVRKRATDDEEKILAKEVKGGFFADL